VTSTELRATAALAAVFALRLLGLFMVYPVFAHYARQLHGATPLLIGLALGGYGLAQGLLQIPFGLASDRIGRKGVICTGLVLFGAGSVIAAMSRSIQGVLLGRVIQGAGAIGSSVLALAADLTREEVRTRAMAGIGMTIGLAFVAALAAGPALAAFGGLQAIFWATAVLAALGVAVTLLVVPTPARVARQRGAEPVPALFGRVLKDRELLRLDFAIFALHAILTASFLAAPRLVAGAFGLPAGGEWKLYVPVLAASVVLMIPAIAVAEARGRMKEVFIAAIVLVAASLAALALAPDTALPIALALTGFFTAFNVMEAMLPSLITKTAPADAKGTATGIYSSAQFLGIFVGGALGGWIWGLAGARGVLLLGLGIAVAWLAVAAGMRRPGLYSTRLVRLDAAAGPAERLVERLRAAPGVVEAVAAPDEGVAYLKVDRAAFEPAALAAILGGAPPSDRPQ
jgi:MFS family permease